MPLAETGQSLGGICGGIASEFAHALFQQFAQKAGDAGVAAGGLDASPLSHVLFQGDGYVAEAMGG